METYEHVTHTFSPVFDETSRILILGSFPSVKSREQQFYYGHPQNRFWKLLALRFRMTARSPFRRNRHFCSVITLPYGM